MGPPEEYFDDVAEYYEAVTPIEHDIEFWVEEARKASGPVLEIGCGTGRVYVPLLEAGVDAYGIDISREMLNVLEEKATETDLEPQVERADMRTFHIDRSFGLVILPLRTIMSALTIEDQRATLRRAREHLTPDGKLIVNVPQPDPNRIAESYGVDSERPVQIEGEQYTLMTHVDFVDGVEEIIRSERRIYDENGELVVESAQRSKLFHKREVDLLLDSTGYSEWTVYSGYDRSEPDPESLQHEFVFVAEP